MVYAVSARDTAKNGVFAVTPGAADAPAALLDGKGKYAKLTWDENQTQLAFLSDRDDAAAKQPKWKLYRWDRQSPAAAVLVSADTPGFRKEFVISDKGTLSFSKDGTRVFFACAPPAPEKKDAAADALRRRRQGRGGPVVVQGRLHPAHPEGPRRARSRPHLHRRLPDSRSTRWCSWPTPNWRP